jgi:hypothetical protein
LAIFRTLTAEEEARVELARSVKAALNSLSRVLGPMKKTGRSFNSLKRMDQRSGLRLLSTFKTVQESSVVKDGTII